MKFLPFVLLSLVLAACGKPAGAPPAFPPPEVTTQSAKTEPVEVAFEYVGQTEGSLEVEVRGRVTGIVQQRLYDEGKPVRAGAPLFVIDPAPFEVALAQAQAEEAAAEARAAQAGREAARLKPLFAARAVSQREFDDATSASEIAAANVKMSQAKVREAQLNLGYTRVNAPIDGVTGRALKSVGSLVTANADSLLTKLARIDPIYVNFSLAEGEQLRLRKEAAEGRLKLPGDGGYHVELILTDGTVYAQKGRVNFADARVNTTTGTIENRAVFANPARSIVPGQFVRVRVNGAVRPAAILIPQRAVLEGPQGKFVYVVKDGKAEVRPVELGEWRGDRWIVSKGVEPADEVVVDGVMKLQPGAPVRVAGAGGTPSQPPQPGEPGKNAPAQKSAKN